MAKSGHIDGLAAVLLIAAVIAAVVNAGEGSFLSMKSIESICKQTDYKDVCERTLAKAANSSSPKEFIRVAFQAASEEVKTAKEFSGNVSQGAKDQFNKNAFDDCKALLEDAAEELQAALMESDSHQGMASRTHDIRTWLSAVITYQQTCIDGITQPDLREKMEAGLRIVAKVTSNAIAILDGVIDLLKAFDIPKFNFSSTTSRRLMSDNGEFPAWFAASDRKLLASQNNGSVTPNAVVAQDGSGDFKDIQAALAAMPKRRSERYIIYVKAGVYKGQVLVTKDMTQLFMYGDGPRKTIVTGSLNNVDGVSTMNSATFSTMGQGFIAKSMGFSNTAGAAKHQAVALHVKADRAAFFNCRMDAFQDTLYVHAHRQFYRNCVVSGTIDFIFGDSSTLMQNCLIIVRRPMDNQQNTVTAHGKSESKSTTALVIQNCRIVPDQKLYPDRFKIKSYLGRPWKAFSKTVIMESTIGDLIQPEGWLSWQGEHFEDTLYYAEHNNRGPGAGTSGRVKWKGFHVIDRKTAEKYTAEPLLLASEWIQYTGITYTDGLRY